MGQWIWQDTFNKPHYTVLKYITDYAKKYPTLIIEIGHAFSIEGLLYTSYKCYLHTVRKIWYKNINGFPKTINTVIYEKSCGYLLITHLNESLIPKDNFSTLL